MKCKSILLFVDVSKAAEYVASSADPDQIQHVAIDIESTLFDQFVQILRTYTVL